MAELLYQKKEETKEGDIIEWTVWKVEKSKDFPHSIKYRLVYVHDNKRILGYDNERSKGDHKHYLSKEIRYEFVNVEKLFEDFEIDILKIRRILYGNKKS